MSNNFYKNYGTHTLSQSKRLIVNNNSNIHTLHLCCTIGDVEQNISLPNFPDSYIYKEIAEGNWGNNIALELNLVLYPIPENKKIVKNETKKEYRLMININVFSKELHPSPENKQLVKELFYELAENAEQDIHIHVMDYYCLESND